MDSCDAERVDDIMAIVAATDVVDCRDRELANLRSLLRSVTGKLENVAALLESPMGVGDEESARRLVDSVLEVLS